MNGALSIEQRVTIWPFVDGRVVTDVGAGDGALAVRIATLGAREVVAIDKHVVKYGALPKITPVISHFEDYKGKAEVAFVSWPPQWGTDGIVKVIERAERIIYLGSNMDGTVCGSYEFWDLVTRRRVLQHVPGRRNTLIIYDREKEQRKLLPEEFAALNQRKIYSYNELYQPEGTINDIGAGHREHRESGSARLPS